jgi:hypothetical protein
MDCLRMLWILGLTQGLVEDVLRDDTYRLTLVHPVSLFGY